MESIIGEKYILWRTEFSLDAYKDQFNKSHNGYVVLGEFVTKVIEVKEVKGMWGSDIFQGVKTSTEDGKIFTRNWNYFPDDSMTPTYYWDAIKDKNGVWQPVDAIQALNHGLIHVDKNENRKVPIGVSLCDRHNIFYDTACWRCDYEKSKGEK